MEEYGKDEPGGFSSSGDSFGLYVEEKQSPAALLLTV